MSNPYFVSSSSSSDTLGMGRAQDPRLKLGYQHRPAYDHGYLSVSEIHTVHYEQYGNPVGKPVIYLHGGPGGHTSIASTVYFNPLVYRVVLLDQRGCGKSRPHAEIRENTSQALVADLETLRTHLNIKKWHLVFGGSWGSTLALLYAQTHPSSVGCLVVRGILLFRKCETDWLYNSLAPKVFPDMHAQFIRHIPPEERSDLPAAYYRRLCSEDYGVQIAAALQWNTYESSLTTLTFDSDSSLAQMIDQKVLIEHARLEAHYAVNNGFLEEGQLLKEENVERMRHIPASIVQGRYDMVTPVQSSYDLYKKWPEAAIYIVADAGHSAKEPGTHQKLIEVCDSYSRIDTP